MYYLSAAIYLLLRKSVMSLKWKNYSLNYLIHFLDIEMSKENLVMETNGYTNTTMIKITDEIVATFFGVAVMDFYYHTMWSSKSCNSHSLIIIFGFMMSSDIAKIIPLIIIIVNKAVVIKLFWRNKICFLYVSLWEMKLIKIFCIVCKLEISSSAEV